MLFFGLKIPFSVYALAEKVYIDGAIAFDKEKGLVPIQILILAY